MATFETKGMEAWLQPQLEALGLSPARIEVLESAEETRLRFNSPTPVTMVVLRVVCAFGHEVTAHAAFWQVDGEWELIEVG